VGNIGNSALDGAAPPRARPTTVLFAEVTGAPAAPTLDALGHAAALSGGRVLHRHATGMLALFSTPDAAAAAAARMHAYAQALPDVAEKPGVRIGFHTGPVGQRNEDIFGDTVNLALQLADQAKSGQILTSHDTASTLSPALQEMVRPSGHVRVQGKGDLLLGELVWRKNMNNVVGASGAAVRAVLRLTYGNKTVIRRREGDTVSIGRSMECDLPIDDINVSRRHCSIERRGAAFTLRDYSMNGTFVTIAGQVEVRVSELPLGNSGTIALGQSASAGGPVVRYACEFSG
jgi:adenylate cyclase